MHGPASGDPVVPGSEGLTTKGHSRRRFLGYLVAAPVLVTAAQVASRLPAGAKGLDTLGLPVGGSVAAGGMKPIPSAPQLADLADLGDVLILAMAPTSYMIKVTVDHQGT